MAAEDHIPVLAGPAVEWLRIRDDGIYVDCTAGAGGHSALIASQLKRGRLLALDRDVSAVAKAGQRLARYPAAEVIHANYGDLKRVLESRGIPAVDGILLDAGVSSMQLDSPERGFSFQEDGPLDMRMDTAATMSAAEFLRRISEKELAELLRRYGDVGPAKRIARSILRRRDAGRLERTSDLVEAVAEALDFVHGRPDEIRTVFQAIRIAVNEELRWLEAGLMQAIDVLNPSGRLVVIAFHSGEDKVVKNVLRDASRTQRERHADGRDRLVRPARLKLLTRTPVTPDPEEALRNPRAKSARMRVAERRAVKETDR